MHSLWNSITALLVIIVIIDHHIIAILIVPKLTLTTSADSSAVHAAIHAIIILAIVAHKANKGFIVTSIVPLTIIAESLSIIHIRHNVKVFEVILG